MVEDLVYIYQSTASRKGQGEEGLGWGSSKQEQATMEVVRESDKVGNEDIYPCSLPSTNEQGVRDLTIVAAGQVCQRRQHTSVMNT